MIDVKQALRHALNILSETSPSAQVDVEILLAHVMHKTRTYLYTHPESTLNNTEWVAYQHLISKRRTGFPIAYLTGTREFWSLPLRVGQETLIPRPETELLVELALSLLKNNAEASVLDLGTGTGAVALALASERTDWQVVATDISESAIEIARYNASHLGISNVSFCCSDWFSNIPKKPFHAIISNPPYIAANDPHLKQGDLLFEPQNALVSGEDGLEALHHIIQHSCEYLLPQGLLLLEHGYEQKKAVASLFSRYGYQPIQSWQDWQGQDRVSGGWAPEAR